MRLQTGDDADGEVALARERPDGSGDGAGDDAGDLAEQAAAVETVGSLKTNEAARDQLAHRQIDHHVQRRLFDALHAEQHTDLRRVRARYSSNAATFSMRSEDSEFAWQLQRVVGSSRAITPPYSPKV